MNHRERALLNLLLALIVLGGGYFLYTKFYRDGLAEREARIEALEREIQTKRDKQNAVLRDRPKLAQWKQLSLPRDPDLARREYERYLSDLLRKSGFPPEYSVISKAADTRSSPSLTRGRTKEPIYTRLTFNVTRLRGDVASLVKALEAFYKTGLMHQIKNLSIQRPLTTQRDQRPDDLDITMTVEALIVTGADDRTYLVPVIDKRLLAYQLKAALSGGPAGLPLVPWVVGHTGPRGPGKLATARRDYHLIAARNIFSSPPPPPVERPRDDTDFTRFVRLVEVTVGPDSQARFYDRYNNRSARLGTRRGFDTFRILDDDNEVYLRGKVVRIPDTRDIVIQVDDEYHLWHVGDDLSVALRRPLSASKLKELGIEVKPSVGEDSKEENGGRNVKVEPAEDVDQ